MTKEKYEEQKKYLQNEIVKLREDYIEINKPCNVDEVVEITRRDGSKVVGQAKTFGILEDGLVYVTSLAVGTSKKKYISKPYRDIQKVEV